MPNIGKYMKSVSPSYPTFYSTFDPSTEFILSEVEGLRTGLLIMLRRT